MFHKMRIFFGLIFKQPSNDGFNYILKDYIEGHLKAVSTDQGRVKKIRILIKAALAADESIVLMRGILIVGLCVLKIVEPELYKKAINNTLKFKEMEEFFGFNNWDSESGTFSRRNWTYCLADELPDDIDWKGFAFDWGRTNPDRETIIPDFCRLVDSFKLNND